MNKPDLNPSLNFTPTALRNLERLRDFLRTKDIKVARTATKRVLTALQHLEDHPDLGRSVEDRDENYPELIILFAWDVYIDAYRYEVKQVVVLGLWHQRDSLLR